MIFIFDLDYTLFDSDKFKKELAKAFRMSYERFDNDYKDLFVCQGINYSIPRHLEKLEKAGRIDRQLRDDIQVDLKNIFSDTSKYLYPGVFKMLKSIKKEGDYFLLVSFGETEFQKRKIENLRRIKHFFDKIIVTDKQKERALKFLREYINSPVIIVNDKVRESQRIQQMLGTGDVFLITGPYSEKRDGYKLHRLEDLIPYARKKRE